MRVIRCDIYEVNLPFKDSFGHALKERKESGSVFVKLTADSGETGWGESLPRDYVTGETTQTAVKTIQEHFLPLALGQTFASWEETLDIIKDLEANARKKDPDMPKRIGAARCAIELALLDLAGNHFQRSVAEIFGSRKREWIEYSGVIGSGAPWPIARKCLIMRLAGIRYVKIKVGAPDDRDKIKRIRSIMGGQADLRVDANGAWNVSDAIDRIQSFKQYGISSVEQPVRADDYEGLQSVTSAVTTPVMADESLCCMEDARKLVSMDACDYFNIRLSKCGGIFAALEMAEFARNYDKACQLGCQVGESAILSAAGRHFALGFAGLKYFEGSYGTHLLEQDVARENLTFRRRGMGKAISGPGLGIHVLEERIEPHISKRHEHKESA